MKFNKNEFGWKEKVNTNELVTKNDIPHYKETLMFDISGDDYSSFMNNNYFNMSALNLDETKSYIGKAKTDINSDEEFICRFVYDKTNNALICEDIQTYIYNHKSYNGENFIENENSAVLTYNITTMDISESEINGYFKLYEVEKVELDTNCLPKDVNIGNSLTVGIRIGDIGIYSVAEGEEITASGEVSHAEGDYTTASGNVSHAEGAYTTASGNISHAEGGYTTASGDFSHAEGNSFDSATDIIQDLSSSTSNDDILTAWNNRQFSLAKGEASHVEGRNCLALGDYSHAEGNLTTASGDISHAEGYSTKATGNSSHAEGVGSIASGMCSHAEGYSTKASGGSSHAEGNNTIANGEGSHAEGDRTIASSENQHVQGKNNIEDTENKYAHIVGNGEADTARSNAHTLDWNGNAWYAGKLSQDGTPTADKDLTTKKYVDDAIANQPQISFNESGELVVTINGVSKTFVPKQ